MYKVLCDSGFWFGLLDAKDEYHNSACELFELFEKMGDVVFLLPFPSLYEFLKTSICGNQKAMELFNSIVDKNCELVSDLDYREDAFNVVKSKSNYQGRHFSLVDIIIRFIIEDTRIKKDFLLTNNRKDFGDITEIYNVSIEDVLTNQEYGK